MGQLSAAINGPRCERFNLKTNHMDKKPTTNSDRREMENKKYSYEKNIFA